MSGGVLDSWVGARADLGSEPDPAALAGYQLARFRQLLDYARERSPFYQRLYQGIDSGRLRTLADLAALPPLSAEDLRREGGQLLCLPQTRVQRIVTLATSGSSGPPKRLFFSAADLELTVDFFAHGMATMTGRGKRVMICLPGSNPDGLCDLLARGLRRFGAEPLLYGMVSDPAAAAESLRGFRPHCLVGMPRQLLALARLCPEQRPETVLLSAENIPEPLRQELAELWRAQVLAHWGMTETGYGGAVECRPGGGYHLRHADLLVEIIDPASGRPALPGESGEIVFTTLTREAMPLLRYRSNDFSRLINEPCACGSRLPRLGPVQGHDKLYPLTS